MDEDARPPLSGVESQLANHSKRRPNLEPDLANDYAATNPIPRPNQVQIATLQILHLEVAAESDDSCRPGWEYIARHIPQVSKEPDPHVAR